MNLQLLNSRIEQLMRDKSKHEAMIHVIDGAIQDCEYWIEKISEINKEEIKNG